MQELKLKRGKKWIFSIGILLMTAMLALATLVMAADDQVCSGSYCLTIQKVFDPNTPAAVKKAAQNQVYTFRVAAQVKVSGSDEYTPVEEIVHITGEGEATVKFDNAFKVSIIEQTDDGGVEVPAGETEHAAALTSRKAAATPSAAKKTSLTATPSVSKKSVKTTSSASKKSEKATSSVSKKSTKAAPTAETESTMPVTWDVSNTVCTSEMHVNSANATLRISKDGGKIEINRPEGASVATFELTGKPLHDENQSKFEGNQFPKYATIAGGETKEFTNLPQGEYTIRELRAPDGFSVLVGERNFGVGAGEKGTVYINGSDSKITIKAPEPVNGVVRTHHYQIHGGNNTINRGIDVFSGKTGTVEHLKEGLYTIEVSETYDGFKGYTVKYPDTTEKNVSERSSYVTTSDSRSYRPYSVGDADQVEFYGFGPLYDASGKKINSKVTYQVNWGIASVNGGVIRNYTNKSERNGGGSYTLNSLKRLVPTDNCLYFTITSVSNPAVKAIDLKWREYREKEKSDEISKPSTSGDKVEIYGLTENYITITKPEDKNERGRDVKYYYTIEDSDHNLITDFTVTATDQNGTPISVPTGEKFGEEATTVTLRAGQTVKISGQAVKNDNGQMVYKGLKPGGTYTIYEHIEEAPAMPFMVTLNDTSRSVTHPEGEIEITTKDKRTVQISKLGNLEEDNGREYTYNIYKSGSEEAFRTVTLKSGETKNVAEATGSMLPAGSYRIKAMDDQIAGFNVKFTDSSSLISDYIKTAKVTFTNSFSEVVASYHVIHEYYRKDEKGRYIFEGVSPVYTKNCDHNHAQGEGHTSEEVHQLDIFNGTTYTHFDDAYGKVVSWKKGDEEKEVMLEEDDEPYTGPYVTNGTGSNGMGTPDDPGTRDYAYVPLDNKDCAMATEHSHEDGAHEHGAEIIILRYYRDETPPEHGKYNVIHVYYRRTSEGDIWEGNSPLKTEDIGVLTNDNRWTMFKADQVEKVPVPKAVWPDAWKEENEYIYQYDGAAYGRIVESENDNAFDGDGVVGEGKEYRKDDTMSGVRATTEGDQIIVLRYYRTGGYNVVHEYYYRKKADTVDDEFGGDEEEPNGDSGEDVIMQKSLAFQSKDGDSGDAENSFNGTLTDFGGYTYTFEGNREISRFPAVLGGWYDVDNPKEIDRKPDYTKDNHTFTYTYKDAVYGYLDRDTKTYWLAPYKTGVTATETNDEIIILRYYREISENPPENPPKDPENPPKDPENPPEDPPKNPETPSKNPGRPSGGSKNPPKTPETTPANPETPPLNPEIPPVIPETPPKTPETTPANPERPTQLPDPNAPNSPDRITIWEDDVPRTYIKSWDPEKETWVYIPEEDVPLWNALPQTGDWSMSKFCAMLTAVSLCGLIALAARYRKRRNG